MTSPAMALLRGCGGCWKDSRLWARGLSLDAPLVRSPLFVASIAALGSCALSHRGGRYDLKMDGGMFQS